MAPEADVDVALMLVETIVPGRVGLEGILVAAHEDVVVRGRLGGAGERQRPLDHVWKADRPFVGLLGAHRPAEHQLQALNTEDLAEQTTLGADIIADRDIWKRTAIERRRCVAGRGRETIGELTGQDDKIFARVDRSVFADEDFHGLRGSRPHVREQDHVVLRRIQGAVGLVGELGRGQRDPALQSEVSQFEDFMGAVPLFGVVLGRGHASPPLG